MPITPFGRTANRILQMANALILAKGGTVILDDSLSTWFEKIFAPHPQIKPSNTAQDCDVIFQTYSDYEKLHFSHNLNSLHPRLPEFRLKPGHCDKARAAYPEAFVSIHLRNLEGSCEERLKT